MPGATSESFAPQAIARKTATQVVTETGHGHHDHHGAHADAAKQPSVERVVDTDHAGHTAPGHHAASVAPATSRVASTTALSPPCPCGCGGKKKSEAAGGKLGPRALFAGEEGAFTALTARMSAWHGNATSYLARPPAKVPISFLGTHTFS